MSFGFLQKDKYLFPANAGKTIQEVIDGITGFEMIEKAFDWNPGAFEDRVSSKNLRVVHDDLTHVDILAYGIDFGESKLTAC